MRIRKNNNNIQHISSISRSFTMADDESEIFDEELEDGDGSIKNEPDDSILQHGDNDENLYAENQRYNSEYNLYNDNEPGSGITTGANFNDYNEDENHRPSKHKNNNNNEFQRPQGTSEFQSPSQPYEQDIIIFTGNVRKRRRLARITTTVNGTTEITTSVSTPKPHNQTNPPNPANQPPSYYYYNNPQNTTLPEEQSNHSDPDLQLNHENQTRLPNPELQMIMFNSCSNTQVRLPLIIDYFYTVNWISANGEVIKGKCKFCSYEFNCKMKPTSNFSKHAQIHDKLFIEYMKAKEGNRNRRPTLKTITSPARNLINNMQVSELKQDSIETHSPQSPLNQPNSHFTSPIKPNQSIIEQKIAKLIIGSFLGSNLVEDKEFNDLIEIFEPKFEKISRVKMVNQLMPQLLESTDLKLKDLINSNLNDLFATIRVDFFNECNESLKSNLFPLFVGFTISFIDSNWTQVNQTLGCFKLTLLSSVLVQAKFSELCRRFNISHARVFRTQMDQTPCGSSIWQCFKRWSMPGLEMMGEKFFQIDTDPIGLEDELDAFEDDCHDEPQLDVDEEGEICFLSLSF